MAPSSEQVLDQSSEVWRWQGEQEGVDQADHEQEFEPVFPETEPGALHGQVRLAGPLAHLRLRPAGKGQHHPSGVIRGLDGRIGQQILNQSEGGIYICWALEIGLSATVRLFLCTWQTVMCRRLASPICAFHLGISLVLQRRIK